MQVSPEDTPGTRIPQCVRGLLRAASLPADASGTITASDSVSEVKSRWLPLALSVALLWPADGDLMAQGTRARPDLSGTWTLDATEVRGGGRGAVRGRGTGAGGGRGGGTGLGAPALKLVIQQTDSLLSVRAERFSGESLEMRYRLNGRPVPNTVSIGRGAATDVATTSRWSTNRVVTDIVRTVVQTGARVEYREQVWLESDSVLVVELEVRGGGGGRLARYKRTAPRSP